MNSNAASALSFAACKGSSETSHGKLCVPEPNGSTPFPQKDCQYATANLKWSLIVLPATILSGL